MSFREVLAMNTGPLVSIIIRTCGRPHILQFAVKSALGQTYRPLEIVIIEDGANISEDFISQKYPDACIKYASTGRHVGRAQAGNAGMVLASGKYLNFLDDDDILYPNHVEILVNKLECEHGNAAYTAAKECLVIKKKKPPYYAALMKFVRFRQPYSRLLLMQRNYLPIQSVMFSKQLFEAYGGFDITMDQLEDWDLWVRYSLNTSFFFVDQITSEYKVPLFGKQGLERSRKLAAASRRLQDKYKTYSYSSTAYDIGRDVEYLISQYNASPVKRLRKWAGKCMRMILKL